METKVKVLPEALRVLAEQKLVLLESRQGTRKMDAVSLHLHGYSDVVYLIGDLVKVCLLALECEGSSARVPEPNVNIGGVLGVVLDLLPYEEAEFLDAVREMVLAPVEEEDFILEHFFLTMPRELEEELGIRN